MEDHDRSDALIKELQDFVKGRTAPNNYPRKIEFVDELPKTVSGKIKRKGLKMQEAGIKLYHPKNPRKGYSFAGIKLHS